MNEGFLFKQTEKESKKDCAFTIDFAHFFLLTGGFVETGADISVPIVVIYN